MFKEYENWLIIKKFIDDHRPCPVVAFSKIKAKQRTQCISTDVILPLFDFVEIMPYGISRYRMLNRILSILHYRDKICARMLACDLAMDPGTVNKILEASDNILKHEGDGNYIQFLPSKNSAT